MQIYAVGETILDIIFRDRQPRTATPGGSSFNAAITLGRLGTPITFISEMGNDRVGDMIEEFMQLNGVNSRYVSRYESGQSAIALAFLDKNSDAQYQFYKDYPHQRLNVDFPQFQADDLLLFGSFYALNPGIRERVMQLLSDATRAGVTVVYDPNFRSTHLDEKDQLVGVIRENISVATIVRASDEDLLNIFGTENPQDAWEEIRPFCRVLISTASAQGIHLFTERLGLRVEVERIKPVSTIGAGDTFNAGLLYGIYRKGYTRSQISELGREEWVELIQGAASFSREVCLSYDNYLPLAYARKVKRGEG